MSKVIINSGSLDTPEADVYAQDLVLSGEAVIVTPDLSTNDAKPVASSPDFSAEDLLIEAGMKLEM